MNEKTALIIGGIAVVGIAGYFIYSAISSPTSQTGSACSGDWTDYVNPACWLTGAQANLSNEVNTATNEVNTILIIIGVIAVLLVALLAFGPQTGNIAKGVSLFV